jgi:hypothetical protein
VSQENRLIETKRMVEFNQQFQDTVERGVFRKLTMKEVAYYPGLVIFITTTEAFKNGTQCYGSV